MPKCKFKLEGIGWECPLNALPGEDYCYWHLPKDGKKPTEEQLGELKVREIRGVYLENANLWKADLENAYLEWADLENAYLEWADLENAYLREARLQNAYLKWANLKNANLQGAELQNANLWKANLENAYLRWANLENANLKWVNLKNADLTGANLENTDLTGANFENTVLQRANLKNKNLMRANLKKIDLEEAELQRANLHSVMVDPETSLQGADLRYANLYRSYVDRTLTLRDAKVFDKNCQKEINELVADFSKKKLVIDFEKLQEINEKLAINAFNIGGCYILRETRIIPFDPQKGFLLVEDKDKDETTRKIEEELKNVLREKGNEILYLPDKGKLRELYDASYEVYNKLYYFYIQAGKFEEALRMHYRRNEVRRKKRLLGGIGSKTRAVLYDWFLMKLLTGYGVKVERPLIASFITIGIFALLFKLTNGIVKVVNGKPIEPDWFDYLYHSVITFTSLGYSNIQPNLNGHLPQLLVSVESFLGVLMMSLFLYTVTFRISR